MRAVSINSWTEFERAEANPVLSPGGHDVTVVAEDGQWAEVATVRAETWTTVVEFSRYFEEVGIMRRSPGGREVVVSLPLECAVTAPSCGPPSALHLRHLGTVFQMLVMFFEDHSSPIRPFETRCDGIDGDDPL
jgi:hypothetical protein